MVVGRLASLSLVLLVVTSYSSHARLLSGCILGNTDGLMATAASDPTLNRGLPGQILGGSEQGSLLFNGGSGDEIHETVITSNGKEKYKYRTLVFNVLPKGTKQSSGPSKRHNDFNA
uniref:Uncharacterized protein n=1 Tax=Opuntia streptacantha TaxID=393608 RepID=A0A7C9D0Y3_OPUST